MISVGLAFFIGCFFFPHALYAWGPVTHLSYGLEILDNLPMLILPLQELLTRFRLDFLYGCMAADIVIKKDGVKYIHNCHNWDVGIGLLDLTKTPKQRAFIYGYLSHLAADTISHNYYVPYQTVASFSKRIIPHFYWELRLDTLQNPETWEMAKEISKKHHNTTHDKFLKKHLKRTLFSFRTNKFIFNSMMRALPSYKVLTPIFQKSPLSLEQKEIQEYRKLVLEAGIDFLNRQKESKFYLIDPSGKLALNKSKVLKKELRRIHHAASSKEIGKRLFDIKKDFKVSLFQKPYHQKWIVVQ